MKKMNTSGEGLLRSLLLYWLFKTGTSRDAYALAQQMGMATTDEDLKAWLEQGCKVYWSWIQGKAELSDLLMSQQSFGSLATTNREKHHTIKPIRDAANKRWSNDWKQLHVKINTAKSLSITQPPDRELELTWQTALSDSARQLISVGLINESNELVKLSRILPITE